MSEETCPQPPSFRRKPESRNSESNAFPFPHHRVHSPRHAVNPSTHSNQQFPSPKSMGIFSTGHY